MAGLMGTLMAFYPAAGSAITLLPELTSGSFVMYQEGPLFGGGFVSSPNGDSISFAFGSIFGTYGPTGASTHWSLIDSAIVTVTGHPHAGQAFDETCDVNTCTFPGSGSTFSMSGVPPPFTGDLTVTVPGTFSMELSGLVIYPFDPSQTFELTFVREGPATLTFDWQADADDWVFASGTARIEPTPEPTTLLLVGTTAAGLGLARWVKRRRISDHAA
jgi:hypothetical protein